MEALLAISTKKSFLPEMCAQVLCDLLPTLSKDVFVRLYSLLCFLLNLSASENLAIVECVA